VQTYLIVESYLVAFMISLWKYTAVYEYYVLSNLMTNSVDIVTIIYLPT